MDFHLDGMIRLFLIVTFLVVYLVLSLPFLGVERLIARRNRYAADIARLHVVQWAFKVVLWRHMLHGIFRYIPSQPRTPRICNHNVKKTAMVPNIKHSLIFGHMLGFIRRALPCSMANRFTPKNCPRKNRSVWGIIRRGSFSI